MVVLPCSSSRRANVANFAKLKLNFHGDGGFFACAIFHILFVFHRATQLILQIKLFRNVAKQTTFLHSNLFKYCFCFCTFTLSLHSFIAA